MQHEKIVHDLIQGSPEWLAFRLTHFGASEATAMLGLSTKVKRTELLHAKHTGIAKEFSDWLQVNVLDHGHEVEAKARPIIERIFGIELGPVTCSIGKLSASCDGLTMFHDTAFEHKQWNEALAAAVRAKQLPEEHMPQCQQIAMVTGAERVIFVVSDGTEENMEYMEVLPDPAWAQRIEAGWEQFEKDLAEYVPQAAEVKAVGRAPETLPALLVEISGQVTNTNLPAFKAQALAVFQNINRDLQTDEDFADADKTAKWCQGVEDRLKAAKEHALSQTASIDELFRALDEISAEARRTRLDLGKLVEARKQAMKEEIVAGGIAAFKAHVVALNDRLGLPYMPQIPADFGGAIKGMRSLSSMRDAVATTLANAKIAANDAADKIERNLKWLTQNAADYAGLFADRATLVLKPNDDFVAQAQLRIGNEKQRVQAEQDRIREEATAKARQQLIDEQAAAQEKEDALIASIWKQARRIEFDSVPYIQKAIGMFETGAKDWENDPRPRVAAAIAEARAEMKTKLETAQAAAAIQTTITAVAQTAAPVLQAAMQEQVKTGTTMLVTQIVDGAPAVLHIPASSEIPNEKPTLKLGDICARLAPLSITADGLAELGYTATVERNARLYRESDWPAICEALIQHITQVADAQVAA